MKRIALKLRRFLHRLRMRLAGPEYLAIGRAGERSAAALLKAKGMSVLARNWRKGSGEHDLVCLDGAILVFVEVKTRKHKSERFRPEDNLSYHQIERNRRAAKRYLAALHLPEDYPARLDFVAVVRGRFHLTEIRHFVNYAPVRPARFRDFPR
ncbi:MAG: YraN family protein [Victivallaceae bacterium]|nr:YraN family protein [Victivallaceae bacterium]